MPPPDPDRAADLALLLDEARAAGEIARRHHRADIATWEKAGGAGPVTEADIAIDRMLKADLTRARPDFGWLSEETEDTPARTKHEKVFIVDPIDGTRAFMRGEEGFCHALAIAERGEITVACAYFPIRDEMYWAVKGGGAFLDGAPLRASTRMELDGAAALAGAGQMKPESWPGGAPPVRRQFLNSLVWRHCLTASGRFDLAFTLRPAWEWDVAAGALIAAEAGAAVTTAEGAPWVYNAPDPRMPGVVVGPTALHAAIMKRLRPAE
ncbi:inositol monophosphatase family protein [Pikeienuella sp. HZG-20]|uniref:inositol monophosphatase family protein n=1 Tax=Paludibacillus litoralis TaxID=3133267 RepID=UPI0030EC5D24